MPNPIPTKQREMVKSRDLGRCLRCGGVGSEWHHRRSRSVKDDHTHCTCNGVWLCKTCHDWVHAHPFEARGQGWIVSRHHPDPSATPVTTYFTPMLLSHFGDWNYAERGATNE